MIYIIGSGPSSISAIVACVNLNKEVTILDVGYTMNSTLKKGVIPPQNNGNFPQKKVYGSDFPYWHTQAYSYLEKNKSALSASNAKGGFSTVWGAGLLPYMKKEFDSWPISYEEMNTYYSILDSFLPMSGEEDALIDHFPLYHSKLSRMSPSSQFNIVFKEVSQHKKYLKKEGFLFGKSRIAVNQFGERPCTYCKQCIDGCPENIIYSSSHTLDNLLNSPLVHYKSGIKVEKLKEDQGGISIEAFDLEANGPKVYHAEKVFLGCGVYNTTKIMMRSLEAYNHTINIDDSQYFLFPILGPYSQNILNENLFTLAQSFCEIINEDVFPYRVHLSLYGYSSFLEDYVYSKFGPLNKLFKPALDYGLKRTYIGQGYLPSSHSNKISITLNKGKKDTFTIVPKKEVEVEKPIKQVVKHFNKFKGKTKLKALSPFLMIAPIGKSFHLGGSFPMRKNPKSDFETNLLGESKALPNVHLIDSSIFPIIESGPLTYTMMANAYRITSQVNKAI